MLCMLLPTSGKPLILSDRAINIVPELGDKVDIVQDAIDLAAALGVGRPKVAVLAAVETVRTHAVDDRRRRALQDGHRGQIRGGVLNGPFALITRSARMRRVRKASSPRAGEQDILIVPNLEAGNMLAKQMTFSGGADAAGIVLGARCRSS